MSLTSNRGLLLLVVVFAALGLFATLGAWVGQRRDADRVAKLEERLSTLEREHVPDLVSGVRRGRDGLVALKRAVDAVTERMRMTVGVPAGLSRDLVEAYETLRSDVTALTRAVRALEFRTGALEAKPKVKPAAGGAAPKRGGG